MQFIKGGAVINATALRELPPVFKGQQLNVKVNDGPIEIILLGTALEDGQLNQRVKVLSSASTRPFYARVSRFGTVEVD